MTITRQDVADAEKFAAEQRKALAHLLKPKQPEKTNGKK